MKRIISIMSIVLIMIVTFMLGGFTCFKLLNSDSQYKIVKVVDDNEKDNKNNKESAKKDDAKETKSDTTKEKSASKDNKQELDNKNEAKTNTTNTKKVLTIQDAPGYNNADRVGGNYYNKYSLQPGGYFLRCPYGHSIYTINGEWDCEECQEEYERKLRQENEATDFDWEGNVDWDKYE